MPTASVQRTPGAIFLLVSLLASTSCQRLRDLKSAWHAGSVPSATHRLVVEVEPRTGLSIRLDGRRVATASPYTTDALTSGSHVLEVRAMGYVPVTLSLAANPNGPLHLPIRLMLRPPSAFGPVAGASDQAPPAEPAPAEPGGNAAAAIAPSRPPLPGQTRPLHLSIEARPAAAISVDGVAADADSVRLLHGHGQLVVGDMALAYRVRPGRGLELNIPHEPSRDVAWYVGGLQVKAKSQVRLTAASIVLRRVQGRRVSEATVRRLD